MILFLSQMTPNRDGHGGSQRASYLFDALQSRGDVHFVELRRANWTNKDPFTYLEGKAASVQRVTMHSALQTSILLERVPWSIGRWLDIARFGSAEVPHLRRKDLEQIASGLPHRSFDMILAGRLTSAVVIDQMIKLGLLRTNIKVVDFDDLTSKLRRRRLDSQLRNVSLNRRTLELIDQRFIRASEARIAASWDAVSVCTDEDVQDLRRLAPGARVTKVPNVIDRSPLGEPEGDGFNYLFVGSFGHEPNLHGLETFLDKGWPIIQSECPRLKLTVVGMNPPQTLVQRLASLKIELHANVPSVLPFYEACDAVISPIFFGGGTRIKLLEAMALGRPIVTTSLGAEGLGVCGGVHAVIDDEMDAFARSMISLAQDRQLRLRLAQMARRLQQSSFGPSAVLEALGKMLEPRLTKGAD